MKYLKIFETESEYTNYYKNGVPSGVLVYVKDTKKAVFSSNNIDGETKSYELTEGGGASPEEIEELQNIIAEKEAEIEGLNSEIQIKDEEIEGLNTQVNELAEQNTLKEQELDEFYNLTDTLKQVLITKGYTIDDDTPLIDLIGIIDTFEQHTVTFDEDTKTLYVDKNE